MEIERCNRRATAVVYRGAYASRGRYRSRCTAQGVVKGVVHRESTFDCLEDATRRATGHCVPRTQVGAARRFYAHVACVRQASVCWARVVAHTDDAGAAIERAAAVGCTEHLCGVAEGDPALRSRACSQGDEDCIESCLDVGYEIHGRAQPTRQPPVSDDGHDDDARDIDVEDQCQHPHDA